MWQRSRPARNGMELRKLGPCPILYLPRPTIGESKFVIDVWTGFDARFLHVS